MGYGTRLQIEGTRCKNIDELNSIESVTSLLCQAVKAAGMHLMNILGNPMVGREPPRELGRGPGVTGVALLQESHCVIHTYPEKGWFFFELLSCKEFDREKVEEIVKMWAGPKITFGEEDSVGGAFPR